jgi:calpain-7
VPERLAISENEADFNAEAVFNRLKEGLQYGRCLVTVATGELSDVEAERTGLVSTHAYAVLDMREIEVSCQRNSNGSNLNYLNFQGVRLLQLKNPWSHVRWRGNYSELDVVHWTPHLQSILNYDPKLAASYDNGVFWIDYQSILNFFDVFYLNWDPSLFQYTYCIHQMWSSGIGPAKDAYTIGKICVYIFYIELENKHCLFFLGDNPQFNLKVSAGKGSVWILLTRHITSIEDFRENREYITVLVYKNNGKRVYYPRE